MSRLVVIGLVAGLFSAIFGVGGGIIVVPLLILAAGFRERPAMATSLAAIAVISLVGAVTYALHGELKPGAAAVVGLPAVEGFRSAKGLEVLGPRHFGFPIDYAPIEQRVKNG